MWQEIKGTGYRMEWACVGPGIEWDRKLKELGIDWDREVWVLGMDWIGR